MVMNNVDFILQAIEAIRCFIADKWPNLIYILGK